MKASRLAIVLLASCIFPILMVALTPTTKAAVALAPYDVKVDHVVQIRNGGLMVINETVKLLAKQGETVELTNYTLGFPYGYQSDLDYAFAYETSNPDSRLKLELDASMGRTGFYGVSVKFSQTVKISEDFPYEFTVVFVFSNRILSIVDMYNASFPAYPSLTQSASVADLTIVFPVWLNYTESSFENEGVNFTRTSTDFEQYFKAPARYLPEFSEQQGWFVVSKIERALELLEATEVTRKIDLLGLEQMAISDSYRMVSTAESFSTIDLRLPKESFDVSAYDEFGLIPANKLNIQDGSAHKNVAITFARAYDVGEEALFAVHYQLPWKNYVNIEGWSDFHVSVTLFEDFDWVIRKLTVTITLPEGATFASLVLPAGLDSVQGTAFSSSLTFAVQNATPFQSFPFDFGYGRAIFWESFRPTMWMSALVMVIGAIIGAWRVIRPAAAPVPTAIVRIRVEDLKSFVDLHYQKSQLKREIESLETKARKGKIPRRRYKVRKITFENRLTSLSRDLKSLEEKIRMAGPRYNDLMRQMEVAETALDSVEADIRRTEIRYRRGEISPAAYNRLLEDAYRRRDRAKTTIDGVLLRLREETI